jgi:serine/threonine protein phosphatase 1
MNRETAVIGDIHGNVSALTGLLKCIEGKYRRLAFVGDYVNRGNDSAAVLRTLIDRATTGPELVCIAGNHDLAFLKCLEDGDLVAFLRMGGAATINSYISASEPDLLAQLRRSVPAQHVSFLRELRSSFLDDGLLITHSSKRVESSYEAPHFHIFGHAPQPDRAPTITQTWAAIDTGCGTFPDGRLTCLLWPSLEVIQVDSSGRQT